VATLNALGLNGSRYGGPGGRIALLFAAYKNSPLCRQLILDYLNAFTTAGPHALTPSWFHFGGAADRWGLFDTGGIYVTPFESFNGIQVYNNGPTDFKVAAVKGRFD
jgi:hypothetical protein